jgi:copper transport protein
VTVGGPVGMIADVTAAQRPRPGRAAARLRTILAATVIGLLGVLAAPASPASAHAVLVGTSPARGSVVARAPAVVSLTFSEAVNPVEGKIRIIAPDGGRADRGDPSTNGARVVIPIRQDAPRGTYLVSFRVISADFHPVGGAFTFSVGAPSPGGAPSPEVGDGSANPVVTAAFPVVRWVGYVGLLLLVGAALVLALLWPARLSRLGAIRLIWLGAGLVAVATVAEILLQVPYVAGAGPGDIRAADVREALSGQYGGAHLIRLGVLGAALVLLRPIARGKGWGADRVLLAVLGTIGVATWSVSGHPGATPVPMVSVVSDMIHIASMSVWLGGLVMLVVFLLPRANAAELGAIVPVWSRWAMYAVSALLLTGVVQALIEVGSPKALVTTTYGWIVMTKVGLVACVLAVASLSRRLVGPIAAHQEGAARRLRGVVVAEAAIAALILAMTSVLVQTTPARTAAAEPVVPAVQSVTMRDKLFNLTVDVAPAQVGLNQVHLYATTPDGQPATVEEWLVRASLPEQGVEPIDAAILPVTEDHATGQISLPTAGAWRFSFTLRTTEVDQATVTADIPVRP